MVIFMVFGSVAYL